MHFNMKYIMIFTAYKYMRHVFICCSPMDVNYRWSFLVDDELHVERRQRYVPAQTYTVLDEQDKEQETLPEQEIELIKVVCLTSSIYPLSCFTWLTAFKLG